MARGGGGRKFTPDEVEKIRGLRGMGVRVMDLAREYGVHPNSICSICNGRTYKHVTSNPVQVVRRDDIMERLAMLETAVSRILVHLDPR